MGKWANFWVAHDPDDVFSYSTVKFVEIRDRYLGLLHHVFQLAILVYVIGIVIFYQKQFLRREEPDGFVRIAFLNGAGVDNDAAANCNTNYTMGPPYCSFPTQDEIVTGGGSSSAHIATSYQVTDYHKTCSDPITCTSGIVSGPTQYVTANLMSFSISLDHSFQTASGETLGDYTPEGILTSPSKTSSGIEYKNVVKKFRSLAADIIPLPTFLSASQEGAKLLDLDSNANDYLNFNNEPSFVRKSFRDFGVVIILVVNYDNIENYWSGCQRGKDSCILYSYKLTAITKIDDFTQETFYRSYPTDRTTIEKRGIRIIGIVSGSIGSFDFQVLLVQLTTSLALIKIATTIVDQIAIRLLPRKALYKAAKFERTEDFSDIASRNELQMEAK